MSEQETHFAAVIVARVTDDGVPEFLMLDYISRNGNVQLKFPGGMESEFHPETPVEIAARELLQETGLKVATSDLQEVWRVFNDTNGGHTKHFFVCEWEKCSGELRTVPMEDPGGEVLDNLTWMKVCAETQVMVFRTHRLAFSAAVKHFAKTELVFGWAARSMNLV